ncbi:Secreted protein containing planctomycete cytochrome C domain [Planctomycetales bacterium 10988]|nr:Secreted protein containing planctomycete cytochrome C domain [Planctomycetales bacterium 10988]
MISSLVAAEPTEGDRLFTLKVLPLLKEKCVGCHGREPDNLQGGLDVTSLEGLLQGGESGEPSIVPGQPEESMLYWAICWDGMEMPPKENDRLSLEETDYFRDWIAAGAPWPNAETLASIQQNEWAVAENGDGIIISTSGGQSKEWTYRRYDPADVWAFQPLEEPTIPVGYEHPIDAFIGEKLRQQAMTSAERAEPETLIRRASFDLLGLPPSPHEIESFVQASKKNPNQAWENLIERFLASPHYGERWAQHWLDVVRYADTSGFSNDWERSNAWRYRDYVIRAFNEDKPYDQFIKEQIAGDELDPDDPEKLIATGFLRMGPWEHTGMSPELVSRQLYLDDVVNSVGQTFLSTAMRCCKCHDHKFDPLPTKDYYRLYAAFATTQPAERSAPFLPEESKSGFDENRQHVETLLRFAKEKQDALYAKREAAARSWYAERGREEEYQPYEIRKKTPGGDKPPRFVGLTTQEEGELKIREQDVRIWTRRLERFEPLVQSVYNGGDLYQKSQTLRLPNLNNPKQRELTNLLPESNIYEGGDVYSLGASVTPGVLSGLHFATFSAETEKAFTLPETMDGRRLALAEWIAHPENPLTTRSIVNRIWAYHFGKGIAGNPNNFGATGKKPTHPQLLDWLAAEFVEQGWSIKNLHRLIMSSHTYQQASTHSERDSIRELDPNNELLAYFEPRRLSAEELRDAMLAISGELNRQIGGLPIKPEMNREVALAPRMLQFSLAPAWQPSRTPQERNRRSIYAYRVRGLPDPMLEVFNKPNADDSCELRDASSVTPQVFSLMNSEIATQRSIAMALRIKQEAMTPREQIIHGYRLCFGKLPTESMVKTLVRHYEQMVTYHQEHSPQPTTYPTMITRSLVEEFSGEPFEYQEMLDIYKDYTPDVQAADVSPEARAMADCCLLMFNANAFLFIY